MSALRAVNSDLELILVKLLEKTAYAAKVVTFTLHPDRFQSDPNGNVSSNLSQRFQ